jgi:hypothetical protein
MALETNLNEKRKEKGKEKSLTCVARWPGGPLRADLLPLPLSFGPSRTEPPFPLRSLSRPRGPAQESLLPRAPLPCFADERTPLSIAIFFLTS